MSKWMCHQLQSWPTLICHCVHCTAFVLDVCYVGKKTPLVVTLYILSLDSFVLWQETWGYCVHCLLAVCALRLRACVMFLCRDTRGGRAPLISVEMCTELSGSGKAPIKAPSWIHEWGVWMHALGFTENSLSLISHVILFGWGWNI